MENTKKVIKDLKELLLINSKSSEITGVNKLGEKVKELLKEVPLNWEKVSSKNAADFLIARSIENDPNLPTVVLSAHMDTVLPATDIEDIETEDKLYGSGAQDIKGGIIIIIELLKRLNQKGQLKNIIVSLSSEEEIATIHYRETIKELSENADYVLVFEPTLNAKPNEDIGKRSIVLSRRGIQIYDLKVESDGGHSGVLFKKEDRKSSILLLAELILEFEKLADYSKMTTLNSGKIEGGKAFNVIASSANLSFESRFKTNEEFDRVDKSIDKLLKKASKDSGFKINLERRLFFPAMFHTKENNKFIQICKDVASEMKVELEEEDRGGGSEASIFKYYNSKLAVLDGFGIRGDGEHTEREFVYKESISTTLDYAYNVINKIIN